MEKSIINSGLSPNVTHEEIILTMTDPDGNSPIGSTDLILDVVNDFFIEMGLSIEPNFKKTEFKLRFKNYDVFKKFHLNILPQVPFEADPNAEPYIMRVRYEFVPSGLDFEEVLNISTQPYSKMKIPIHYREKEDCFDLLFPSSEAYFMMFLSVVGIEKMLP